MYQTDFVPIAFLVPSFRRQNHRGTSVPQLLEARQKHILCQAAQTRETRAIAVDLLYPAQPAHATSRPSRAICWTGPLPAMGPMTIHWADGNRWASLLWTFPHPTRYTRALARVHDCLGRTLVPDRYARGSPAHVPSGTLPAARAGLAFTSTESIACDEMDGRQRQRGPSSGDGVFQI